MRRVDESPFSETATMLSAPLTPPQDSNHLTLLQERHCASPAHVKHTQPNSLTDTFHDAQVSPTAARHLRTWPTQTAPPLRTVQ